MSFEKLNIILDTVFKVTEWMEVDLINFDGCAWILSFELVLEIVILESQHSTVCMVEDGNLSSTKELLRDDDAPQCLLSVLFVSSSLIDHTKDDFRTDAIPPAFLIICASPSPTPS